MGGIYSAAGEQGLLLVVNAKIGTGGGSWVESAICSRRNALTIPIRPLQKDNYDNQTVFKPKLGIFPLSLPNLSTGTKFSLAVSVGLVMITKKYL